MSRKNNLFTDGTRNKKQETRIKKQEIKQVTNNK